MTDNMPTPTYNPPPVEEPTLIASINTLTFTTSYDSVKVFLQYDGMSNVINTIYCVLTAVDNLGNTLTIGSDISLGLPNPASFTQFDSLTKEQIDEWVFATPEFFKLKNAVISGMNNIAAPVIEIKTLNF